MSALAWLFGLGAATIALPILFHLIRRTPKGQQEFSSLMFLRPSPPTLTRRSRLENLLLLCLRAAVIALIAFAFMRPFFRSSVEQSFTQVANRRVAILVDTSASMKRAGLWEKAKENVNQILKDLEPGDDAALITFDDRTVQQIRFDQQTEVAEGSEVTPSSALDLKQKLIAEKIEQIEPSWARSNLGSAMTTVADQLDVWRDRRRSDDSAEQPKLQIVVVSDLQSGSQTDALQSYQWPADVFVQFETVVATDTDNATVQLLNPVEDEPNLQRIRVENSSGSSVDQFNVDWNPADSNLEPINFYVPAGSSRVLKLDSKDSLSATQFKLVGDTESFDNQFFVVPTVQQVYEVVYLGRDAQDDPENMRFYLERSFVETPSRKVEVRYCGPDDQISSSAGDPILVVVTSAPAPSLMEKLNDYLRRGGDALIVLSDDATTQAMSQLAGIADVPEPAPGEQPSAGAKRGNREYAMLAEIKFDHPLFAPFANPRYNDFTKIRFWQHREISIAKDSNALVLARLDNDVPFLWTRRVDSARPDIPLGSVYVMSSGWQPDESQLARSTKFVPLMNRLVDVAARRPVVDQSLLVHQPIQLPAIKLFKPAIVTPEGLRIELESEQQTFTETDQPGIYTLKTANSNPDRVNSNEQSWSFAVNLDRAESDTEVLPIEKLEMLGIKVGQQETASSEIARLRLLRDMELEGSQKVWKWLIVAAIAFLIVETWYAGRTASVAANPISVTGDAA